MAMVICLTLLINTSFKIIEVYGIVFTASSILCPIVAGLYCLVLIKCRVVQQQQVLNQCLLALYVFSIGIYLLVNLPAAENMRDNIAYQIVFEEIPRKFFASALAFALSFYLPHLYCSTRKKSILATPKKCLILALCGGFFFFSIDFFLLFSDPRAADFLKIYLDSLLIATVILSLIGATFLICLLRNRLLLKEFSADHIDPLFHYLVGFSVVVLLICLACEYRLLSFITGIVLAASSIFFPLIIIASNLIGELYGYKANLRLTWILLASELFFDFVLMLVIVLPSPDFFNLNPFYYFIMPRRIPATTLSLLLAFGTNAWLLEKLKHTNYGHNQSLRLIMANTLAGTLLCLVNYTLLFAGVYPYEQVLDLALSSWLYKFTVSLISLPLVIWVYNRQVASLNSCNYSAQ